MTAAPKRLERRRDHLPAHIVPVERALLERADILEAKALAQRIDEIPWNQIAAEFRELAESLHWQP